MSISGEPPIYIFFQQNLDSIDHFYKESNMHKAENIYFLRI